MPPPIVLAIAQQPLVRLLDCDARDPLHVRARKGLAMVTQERAVLMDLTTAENLKVSRCSQERAVDS